MLNDQISDPQNLHKQRSMLIHHHHKRFTSYLTTTRSIQHTLIFCNSHHQSKNRHKQHTKRDQEAALISFTPNLKQSQVKYDQINSSFPPPMEAIISLSYMTMTATPSMPNSSQHANRNQSKMHIHESSAFSNAETSDPSFIVSTTKPHNF